MVGVDEVGRGAWAGPLLVVAARQNNHLPEDLKDSKLLSKSQRQEILNQLSISCDFGEGWVTPAEIDYHGLAGGLKLGVERALSALKVLPIEEILMDGSVNYVPHSYVSAKNMVKADALVPIVSAASVYAKVKRDRYMASLAKKHPKYGFDKNVGYGTALHQQAIKQSGAILDVHRMSFAPLKALEGRA